MIHVDNTIPSGNSPKKPSIAELAFEALKQDPAFRIYPPAAVALYPDYLEQLAQVLAEDSSKVVTMRTLMEAKAKSVEIGLSSGLISKLIPIMLREQTALTPTEIAEETADFLKELPAAIVALKEFFLPLLISKFLVSCKTS